MLTKRLVPPLAPCVNCSHEYSGAVCPVCKTDHPALTALKNIGKQATDTAPLLTAVRLAREIC